MWSLSGESGHVLVRAIDTSVPALTSSPADNALTATVRSQSVAFSGSAHGAPFSVRAHALYNAVYLPTDPQNAAACELIVDVASHKGSRSVLVSTSAIAIVGGVEVITPPTTLRGAMITNPPLDMTVAVSGVRWPLAIETTAFNNVSISGDADSFRNGHVTVQGDLDTLTMGVWDTKGITINNDHITTGDEFDVQFTGNVGRVAVSGHPTQGSMLSVSSTPPSRVTTVTGGDGWDTFVLVDQVHAATAISEQAFSLGCCCCCCWWWWW